MSRRLLPILGLLLLSAGLQAVFFLHANQVPDRDLPGDHGHPAFLVDAYDPERSAADDIQAALPRARAENKRVLLFTGADWCGWCHRLSDLMHEHEAISAELTDHYLVIKVAYSSRNAAYLDQYPEFQEFPHLFVLDAEGELLTSHNPAGAQTAGGYRAEKVLGFLQKWAPQG